MTTDQACVVPGEGAGSGGQPGDRRNRPATETGSGRPSVKPVRLCERNGRQKGTERQKRHCSENTLHTFLHVLANATATATTAVAADTRRLQSEVGDHVAGQRDRLVSELRGDELQRVIRWPRSK